MYWDIFFPPWLASGSGGVSVSHSVVSSIDGCYNPFIVIVANIKATAVTCVVIPHIPAGASLSAVLIT